MYSRIFNICRTIPCRSANMFDVSKRLCHTVNTTEKTVNKNPKVLSKKFPEYQIIYTYRMVKLAAGINKMKRKLGAVFIGSLSLSGVLSLIDLIPMESILHCAILLGPTTISINAVGWYCNNLIAYVYLNREKEKVIISYVDIYGGRKDIEAMVTDIPHLSDLPVTAHDKIFKTLNISSCKDRLKLPTIFWEFIDQEQFEYLFGKNEVK